jgi:hypothetical protein
MTRDERNNNQEGEKMSETKALDELFNFIDDMDKQGFITTVGIKVKLQAAAELESLKISIQNAHERYATIAKLCADLDKAQEYGDHWQEIAQAETKKLATAQAGLKYWEELFNTHDQTLKLIDAERAKAQAELMEWENRQGSVCPEDFGFEEVITHLRSELERETKFACEMRTGREEWRNTAKTATARMMELSEQLAKAQKQVTGGKVVIEHLLQFLDDNKMGKDECVCDDGDDSVGMGATLCEYHEAKNYLSDNLETMPQDYNLQAQVESSGRVIESAIQRIVELSAQVESARVIFKKIDKHPEDGLETDRRLEVAHWLNSLAANPEEVKK